MVRIGVKVRRQATTQQKCQFLALSRLIWLIATLTLSDVVGGQRFQTPTERILNRRLANIREVEWNAPKVLPPVAKNPAVFPELVATKSPKRLFPPLVSKVPTVSQIIKKKCNILGINTFCTKSAISLQEIALSMSVSFLCGVYVGPFFSRPLC